MRFVFIIFLTFSLNSCGNLMSASLIESFLTPSSLVMTAADYGIEKETGKNFQNMLYQWQLLRTVNLILKI